MRSRVTPQAARRKLRVQFRFLVETVRDCGCNIINQNNLTIIEAEAFAWLTEYLAEYEVAASRRCFTLNVERVNE